jgi:hypothetical protein
MSEAVVVERCPPSFYGPIGAIRIAIIIAIIIHVSHSAAVSRVVCGTGGLGSGWL